MRCAILYTALILLVALNAPAYAQDLFGLPTHYAVGFSPRSVFSADLDGDGDNDLAVVAGGNVSVLMNNGDGTFAPKVDYPAGGSSLFSVDLDGDGDNDLVTSGVSVLLNNGDGTFAPKVDYSPRGSSLFSADLDGDGDNDLAVAGRNVSVLLNLSNVTPPLIVTSISPTFGSELGGTPVTIKGSNFQSGATVTFGDSSVTNVAVGLLGTITLGTPTHPVGTVDVIVTNPDGQADTLENGFEVIVPPPPVVTSVNPTSDAELVGTPVSVTIKGSNFQRGATVTFGSSVATNIAVVNSTTITAVTPAHPVGIVDVTVTNPDGQAGIRENGFTFVPALFGLRADYAAGNRPGSVFGADVDGDGDYDLAVANYESDNVSVLLNKGDGTFAPEVDYSVENEPSSVFIADLDGDGDNDMAVTNSGSCCDFSVSVLMNNGDGTLAPKMDYPAGGFSVFSADVDGDGDNDLVTSQVSVLLNNGDGTFAPKVHYQAGSGAISVFSADLDGDGDNHLAVANQNGDNVSVLLNKCWGVSPFSIY